MNGRQYKTILWCIGILLLIFLGFFFYQMTKAENFTTMMVPLMLILGLILGGTIAFLASKKLTAAPPVITEKFPHYRGKHAESLQSGLGRRPL